MTVKKIGYQSCCGAGILYYLYGIDSYGGATYEKPLNIDHLHAAIRSSEWNLLTAILNKNEHKKSHQVMLDAGFQLVFEAPNPKHTGSILYLYALDKQKWVDPQKSQGSAFGKKTGDGYVVGAIIRYAGGGTNLKNYRIEVIDGARARIQRVDDSSVYRWEYLVHLRNTYEIIQPEAPAPVPQTIQPGAVLHNINVGVNYVITRVVGDQSYYRRDEEGRAEHPHSVDVNWWLNNYYTVIEQRRPVPRVVAPQVPLQFRLRRGAFIQRRDEPEAPIYVITRYAVQEGRVYYRVVANNNGIDEDQILDTPVETIRQRFVVVAEPQANAE